MLLCWNVKMQLHKCIFIFLLHVHVINFIDTHALVQFYDDDYETGIVPLKRVERNQELYEGDACFVLWSDMRRYSGIFICSGMFGDCFCVAV